MPKFKELGRRRLCKNLTGNAGTASSASTGQARLRVSMGSHFFFPRYFSIAIVLVGAQVLNARFISIAFGGRLDLVGAPIFISIAVSGRMALVGAPLFISIAFGDRIALDGAPRFISISFGGRMVLVGALRNYMGIPLKIHKIL